MTQKIFWREDKKSWRQRKSSQWMLKQKAFFQSSLLLSRPSHKRINNQRSAEKKKQESSLFSNLTGSEIYGSDILALHSGVTKTE